MKHSRLILIQIQWGFVSSFLSSFFVSSVSVIAIILNWPLEKLSNLVLVSSLHSSSSMTSLRLLETMSLLADFSGNCASLLFSYLLRSHTEQT